jgi:hypothetical protein
VIAVGSSDIDVTTVVQLVDADPAVANPALVLRSAVAGQSKQDQANGGNKQVRMRTVAAMSE